MKSGIYYRGRADHLVGLPANPSAAGAVDAQDHSTYMNGYNSVSYSLTPKKLKEERELLKKDLASHLKELLREAMGGPTDMFTDVDRAVKLDLEIFRELDPQIAEVARGVYNELQVVRAKNAELPRAKQINKESEC